MSVPVATAEDPRTPPPPRPPTRRKKSEKTQTQLRDELFANGSAFKTTDRPEIVGIDNVMTEIDEIVHWLRNADEYARWDSRLQPGVIFEGEPGTGKTLVSRYIASASNAIFINCRDFPHKGSLFNDADIRDLFRRARKAHKEVARPIILFWDEFEIVAKERGSSETSAEQEAVVSQLTAELDGVEGKNSGVLLIGCTNYAHSIDNALKRRGRMGLHIEFHAPDREGKEKILGYYLDARETEGDIDCETLSYFFSKRATAADIEEAVVEAWRNAVGRTIKGEWPDDGKIHTAIARAPKITEKDLIKVFIKHLVGPPTTFTLPEDERLRVAVHEVGHAIASLVFGVPLRLITVQPGKRSLGRVMNDELKEYISTMEEYINWMKVGMGGIAAEKAAGLAVMVGCTGDIKAVNETASNLVDRMIGGNQTGVFNLAAFGGIRKYDYSSVIPYVGTSAIERSDEDIRLLVDMVEKEANGALLHIGGDAIWEIARTVNEKTTMTGQEFRDLFCQVTGKDPEKFAHVR